MTKVPDEVKTALDWVEKVIKFFEPYKPEKKMMRINCINQTSEIGLLINIPDQYKRKVGKIKIPAYQNFQIYEMMTEDFNLLDVVKLWTNVNGQWVLNTSVLPPVDNFFLKMRGYMSPEIISKMVFVDEAKNRDQTEEIDRYWLKCMIKDVELIENVWNMLEIQHVNVGIKVGINRCFSTAVPNTYHKKIEAAQRFLRYGQTRDRQKVFHAWNEYRKTLRMEGVSIDALIDLIGKLTSGETFGDFVHVERPYTRGPINREQEFSGPFPNYMRVQALTDLDLKNYVADSYMVFEKKKYIDKIKEKINA